MRLPIVRLVAQREVSSRVRTKSFVISTAITVAVLLGFIVLPRLFGANKPPSYQLGTVGARSTAVGQAAAAQAQGAGVRLRLVPFRDARSAEAALRERNVTAVLMDRQSLLVDNTAPERLTALIQGASGQLATVERLQAAGLSPAQVRDVLRAPSIAVRSLHPVSPKEQANKSIAFVAVFLLYGQILGYGMGVASGVVEEKSSRVVEVLLAAVRPSELLAGKILGIGLVGLLQLAVIGAVALVAARLSGALVLHADAIQPIGLALVWFVLGFGFYSCCFAVAGAIVSRQEELQNTTAPLNLLVVGSFIFAITTVNSPGTGLARVAMFLPPVAPLVMPPRVAGGEVAAWQVVLATLISLATVAALVPLAGRLYAGAILRLGARVKLRDAWRAAGGGRPRREAIAASGGARPPGR